MLLTNDDGLEPWSDLHSIYLYEQSKQKQKGAQRLVLPTVEGQEGGKWIVIDSGMCSALCTINTVGCLRAILILNCMLCLIQCISPYWNRFGKLKNSFIHMAGIFFGHCYCNYGLAFKGYRSSVEVQSY